jgi:hypothetical protein
MADVAEELVELQEESQAPKRARVDQPPVENLKKCVNVGCENFPTREDMLERIRLLQSEGEIAPLGGLNLALAHALLHLHPTLRSEHFTSVRYGQHTRFESSRISLRVTILSRN